MMPIAIQLQSSYVGFEPAHNLHARRRVGALERPPLTPEALREEDAALRTAIAADPHLNVLVQCLDVDTRRAFDVIAEVCPARPHLCLLPGPLELPTDDGRRLLSGDVSTLRLQQQIALYDWIESRHESVQVISFTSVPLWPMVSNGRFLEGLFYRLNVMSVSAAMCA